MLPQRWDALNLTANHNALLFQRVASFTRKQAMLDTPPDTRNGQSTPPSHLLILAMRVAPECCLIRRDTCMPARERRGTDSLSRHGLRAMRVRR